MRNYLNPTRLPGRAFLILTTWESLPEAPKPGDIFIEPKYSSRFMDSPRLPQPITAAFASLAEALPRNRHSVLMKSSTKPLPIYQDNEASP
jgi:hypothetical protein